MSRKPNRYDENIKDALTSKTVRYFGGCVFGMFAFACAALCMILLLAPALTDAILRSIGLQ